MLPKGNYIVAVSGGVDSIVLIDMIMRQATPDMGIVVAHFDHGIRSESAEDANFVAAIARSYGVGFEVRREELGADASEAYSRERRYAFLRLVAAKYNATIVTAHHADDVAETVAINVTRGTGWRGLAVMDAAGLVRPLLAYRKKELIRYAVENKLAWHEDATNNSEKYLRNRLRKQLVALDDNQMKKILTLRDQQIILKQKINHELTKLITPSPYKRHFFIMIDDAVAYEVLQFIVIRNTGTTALMPQLRRALLAIKTATPGTQHDIGQGVRLEFTKTHFVVNAS